MANEQQPGKPLSAQGAARRRFTRAGAAASGVLLTVHSQPGMAAVICAGPSGFQSGLVSARNVDPGACAGRSPGFWKNADTAGSGGGKGKPPKEPLPNKVWPAGATANTKFRTVFTCTAAMGQTYGSDTCTLDWILGSNAGWDKHNLGAHLVAAYLNVLAGYTGYLTVNQLNAIWNEWRDYGYYTPTAGVKWTASQIVQYLSGTMS
ncbi:hypothetical protein [Pseudoduganella violaceinigra]|uniref:hypothetical protein n=1 Tax=Pseudoduganella violaceinigra TaxID=246602 RepID=UPI0004076DE0|nr:hypothetical protein [Pseudoduganella violaceinigra]